LKEVGNNRWKLELPSGGAGDGDAGAGDDGGSPSKKAKTDDPLRGRNFSEEQ
jgi:hypothetical protein